MAGTIIVHAIVEEAIMEHRTLDELQHSAEVRVDAPFHEPMSPRERLGRWAQLLEADPLRRLNSLDQTEYRGPAIRDGMRCDGSPISIAFDDPVLRAEGLAGDTYGAAKRFFGLSDGQLHYVVCYCHCGARMLARDAALRVRSVTPRSQSPGLFARILRVFGQ
jgi:hypothetical protein